MGWVELHHTRCNLPNAENIKKVHAQPGSVWKCGDAGCDKIYVLESDWNFLPAVTMKVDYVSTGNEFIPIEGLEDEDENLAGLSCQEREEFFMKKARDAKIMAERTAMIRAQIEMNRKLPPPPKPGMFERVFGTKIGE